MCPLENYLGRFWGEASSSPLMSPGQVSFWLAHGAAPPWVRTETDVLPYSVWPCESSWNPEVLGSVRINICLFYQRKSWLLHFVLLSLRHPPPPPSFLLLPVTICFKLAKGEECVLTWPLGRGQVYHLRRDKWEGLPSLAYPSAEIKSLVEISSCSCVSFSDTDDPSQGHFSPTARRRTRGHSIFFFLSVVFIVFLARWPWFFPRPHPWDIVLASDWTGKGKRQL